MCLICTDYALNKLTIPEALRNLEEMKPNIGDTHYNEVLVQLEMDTYYSCDFPWEEIGFGD